MITLSRTTGCPHPVFSSFSCFPYGTAVNIEKRILLSSHTGITARRRQTFPRVFRQAAPVHLLPLNNLRSDPAALTVRSAPRQRDTYLLYRNKAEIQCTQTKFFKKLMHQFYTGFPQFSPHFSLFPDYKKPCPPPAGSRIYSPRPGSRAFDFYSFYLYRTTGVPVGASLKIVSAR